MPVPDERFYSSPVSSRNESLHKLWAVLIVKMCRGRQFDDWYRWACGNLLVCPRVWAALGISRVTSLGHRDVLPQTFGRLTQRSSKSLQMLRSENWQRSLSHGAIEALPHNPTNRDFSISAGPMAIGENVRYSRVADQKTFRSLSDVSAVLNRRQSQDFFSVVSLT